MTSYLPTSIRNAKSGSRFSAHKRCPCIARQQALSSWLIATLVKQAIRGAAVVSSRRIATTLAKRRTDNFNIAAASPVMHSMARRRAVH
jgi:hypothetical protein